MKHCKKEIHRAWNINNYILLLLCIIIMSAVVLKKKWKLYRAEDEMEELLSRWRRAEPKDRTGMTRR